MSETIEHKAVDRTGWPAGPWDNEPDRVEWRTAAGLHALITRQSGGHLCGYVAVPPGHPCHGFDYTHEYPLGPDGAPDYSQDHKPNPTDGLQVHGGITYGEACRGSVCHVPPPGEPADVHWLGFDCNHGRDVSPAGLAFDRKHGWGRTSGAHYKTVDYVRGECERLAVQLAQMAVDATVRP